ncbi:MAG: rhomboid family intramembrane serine protease [Balneolales bacterium]
MAYILLFTTVAVSYIAWYYQPHWQHEGMLCPYYTFREGKWYQLLTSGFLHADGNHLLFNMVTFFFFAPTMEQVMGMPLFVTLYITGIIVSSLPTLFKHRDNPNYASLGASGGVEAILFAYILLFPLNNLYLMLIPIGIPAIVFGALFMGYSYYEAKKKRGNVNHEAHIAGAIYGILFTLFTIPDAFVHFLAAIGLIN